MAWFLVLISIKSEFVPSSRSAAVGRVLCVSSETYRT